MGPVWGTFTFETREVGLLESFFDSAAEGEVKLLKMSVREAVLEGNVQAGGLDFVLEVIPK